MLLKKLSNAQRLRLIRISRLRLKQRRQRRQKESETDKPALSDQPTAVEGTGWHKITVYKRGKVHEAYAHKRELMPQDFCLVKNYDAVVAFLQELRQRLSATGNKILKARMEGGYRNRQRVKRLQNVESYSDFATIQRITPAAALVLASEYDRMISLYNVPEWLQAINIEKWKREVFTTLQDVGFLSLLNVDAPPINMPVRDGKYIVPFLSGSKVHGLLIDKLIRTMAELAGASGIQDSDKLLQMSRVYDGLGEAIQNVEITPIL